MITIKIDGIELDLAKDIKLSFKIENPFFSENLFNTFFSYSTTIPQTEKNKILVKKKKRCAIYFKNVLFFDGKIESYKENIKDFEINLINRSKDIVETLKTTNLDQLKLKEFVVCNADDTPEEKLDKWQDHLGQNILDSELQKTHVFPPIKTLGYNESGLEETNLLKTNTMHFIDGNIVNRFLKGFYELNFFTNRYFFDDDVNGLATIRNEWVTTVAPCPKIKYLFEQINSLLSINVKSNDLSSIEEFEQLWLFNNKVLDQFETQFFELDNVFKVVNNFADSYNLINHVPNTSCYSVFELLNEIFDAVFVYENSSLKVYLTKNILKQKTRNLSKYANISFITEDNDNSNIAVSYNEIEDFLLIDTDVMKKTDNNQVIFNNRYTEVKTDFNTKNEKQISFQHIPLPTYSEIRIENYILNEIGWQQKLSDPEGFRENPPYAGNGYLEFFAKSPAVVKSDLFDNGAEIFDRIFYGLFRGRLTGYQKFVEYDTPDQPETFPFTPIICNFKSPIISTDDAANFLALNPIYGNTSVHINGPDNAFDLYKKPKLQLLYNSTIKTKMLYLPLFELLNLLKWEDFKHTIQQKKESFTGYVKSVSFTLSNRGLSACEMEYIIPNKKVGGEFNDDFNEDFNID